VEQRAAAGDAEAMFALANWRLFALHGPRDLPAAHQLLRKAAGRACGGGAHAAHPDRQRHRLRGRSAGSAADHHQTDGARQYAAAQLAC
jgi:hypothetical protein